MKKAVLICLVLLLSLCASAQFKLYEDVFAGGVVTGGYSNGATIPSGSGSFNVNIPPGSAIHKAYLIAGRLGLAPDVTVTLNGAPFTFNASNNITSGFNSIYGGSSGVHAIDITASINPATSAYTIAVPVQNTVSNKYPEFYLYIAFDNAALPTITSAIFLNTSNFVTTMPWTLNTANPVSTANPVGLAVLGGYAGPVTDCELVNVNGTPIGNFSGQDFNASSQWGAMAGFQYYNNTLVGYNDDNANQAMSGPDALSNIAAIIPNNTTSIPLVYSHCNGTSQDNNVFATFLTWSGGVVLDAEIGWFEAEHGRDGMVDLTWSIVGDDPVSYFVIERGNSPSSFEEIGDLQGNATNYLYTDGQPLSGKNYYRLRYVGENGTVRYSEVRSVNMSDKNGLIVNCYPNPVESGADLHVRIDAPGATYVIYSLADGREIAKGILDLQYSTDGEAAISTQGISSGLYYLGIFSGEEAEYVKFRIR